MSAVPAVENPTAASPATSIFDDVRAGAELLTLAQAARHPLLRSSPSSIYRAIKPGRLSVGGRRVRLEVIKAPAGLRTTAAAIERMIARLSDDAASDARAPMRLAPAMRQQQMRRASSRLAAEGI